METQHRDFHLLSSSQSAYDIVFLSYKKEGTCKTAAMKNLHTWVQVEVIRKPYGPKSQSCELYESKRGKQVL